MRKSVREVTPDPIMQRIMDALEKCGLSANELVTELGLGKNTFDNWKFGSSKSYLKYIDKIADITGTSLDYLIRGTEMNIDSFTAIEKEIVEKFRLLNRERQDLVYKMLSDLEKLTGVEPETTI